MATAMPHPRADFITVTQGMTQTSRSSTRGVARELSTRPSSPRGAMAIQPTGSSPSKAIRPGARRRRASFVMASRRRWFMGPEPGSSRIPASVRRGCRHQQLDPQLPRRTVPMSSIKRGVKGGSRAVGVRVCLYVSALSKSCVASDPHQEIYDVSLKPRLSSYSYLLVQTIDDIPAGNSIRLSCLPAVALKQDSCHQSNQSSATDAGLDVEAGKYGKIYTFNGHGRGRCL